MTVESHAVPKAGALGGTRVIALGGIGPVAFASMLLADMGADVILLDRPGTGTRASPETEAPLDAVLRRGQRSMTADLKSEDDRATVRSLIGSSDVVLEGFRPGVTERLGFGPEDCLQLNDRLIYGRATGWGQDGPMAGAVGHDLNYIAAVGVLGSLGPADRVPPPPHCLLGDFAGGAMFLTIGVLAALLERVTSGRGQVIDAAMIDGAALLMSPIYAQWSTGSWVDVREANIMDGGAPFYRCYRTRDGGFMSVAAVEPAFYANFLRVLLLDGVSPSAQWNRARWPEVAQQIAGEFSKRTRSYWVEAFQDVEACVEPVLGIAESLRHPQAVARGLFNVVDGLVQVSPAPRFSRTPNKPPNHWARSGEHTVEIRDEVRNEAVNVRRGPSPL